ncbi:acyltransferase family protein [Phocaeicola coprocola]|uniref:acyltransferase family protein n=1 Tax=Phocaeicola coprocola TaxID=310298 RepID=UPI00266F81FD|nr:acyltransferase [Phocaeicola coprocola]
MKRNVIIDIVKYIAAIFVIAIHTRPFKNISSEIDFFFVDIICRFAVPFFAVCTGFYVSSIGEKNGIALTIRRSLYKMTKLYIFWSLIYLIYLTFGWIKSGSNITWLYYKGWLQGTIISFSFYHLWYLISMCYGLCFLILIKRFVNEKLFIPIIITLWILQTFVYAYDSYFNLLPIIIKNYVNLFPSIFNGLTLMLPLLLIGSMIKKYGLSLSNTQIRIGLLISVLGLIIEVYFLRWIGVERWSFVLLTLPCAFFVFTTLYKMGQKLNADWHFSKYLAYISLIVYCIHPIIIGILKNNGIVNPMVVFLLTSIISTIISLIYIYLKQYKLKKLQL